MSAPVVLDTDIFGALYINLDGAVRQGHPVDTWRTRLTGRRVLISFQTRAEVLGGFRISNWGAQRIESAIAKLDATPTIPADHSVIDAFAELTASCRRAGHGLHNKEHAADRWVAAAAIAKGLTLFARDGVYRNAPGLTLLE